MRVSCLQENLARGLAIVGRAVSSRSTLPVLGNILLATDRGRLRLAATNLEIGINCWIGAKIEEEGATTVPARILTDFVNSLPPERIDMELTVRTQSLNLKCARYEANIKGIDAAEFPPILSATPDGAMAIGLEGLKTVIEQVVFAAATDESRPTLTGVLARFQGDQLTLAATDGYRLSVRTAHLVTPAREPISVIIPARALAELARIVSSVEGTKGEGEAAKVEITIPAERNQILFHLPSVDLVSQLIEATFPDYAKIIPTRYETRTVMDTANFLKAVRVAHLFARDAANIVRLQISPTSAGAPVGEAVGEGMPAIGGQVTLSATSAEVGDNVGEVDATVEGPPAEIAFNAKFLIDVLSVVDAPQVVLETTQPGRPGVIRPVGSGDFLHVIMPMHSVR